MDSPRMSEREAQRRTLGQSQIVRCAKGLYLCITNDQLVRAKLILKNLSTNDRIAVVSTRTADDNAALFLAAQLGNVQFVNLLIEEGHADIEQLGTYEVSEDRSKHKVSPLWCAAVTNRLEVVKALVRHGADVNAPSDTQSTPVRSACYMTNVDVVKFLVDEAKADIHKPNMNGGTCLINSVQSTELCQFLIDRGADVNARDNSGNLALHYAIREGRLETVKMLLKSGSDAYSRNDFGDDAIQSAALRGYQQILEYLLSELNPPSQRVIEALELMGANCVDEKHDIQGAVSYWQRAVQLRCDIALSSVQNTENSVDSMSCEDSTSTVDMNGICGDSTEPCKSEVRKAYGVVCRERGEVGPPGEKPPNPAYKMAREPRNVKEVILLGNDRNRVYMQALLVRERILGASHKDTMFGLMYRGAVYADTRDYESCVHLWKYAFFLRHAGRQLLSQEYLFTLQALCKLFWEVLDDEGARHPTSQQFLLDRISSAQEERQPLAVKFVDAYEVLEMTVEGIGNCRDSLMAPQDGCRRQEDLLITLQLALHLIQLMIRMNVLSQVLPDDFQRFKVLVHKLLRIDVRLADGRTVLHLAVDHKTSTVSDEFFSQFPSAEVVSLLLECGARPDDIDSRANTPLHGAAQQLAGFHEKASSAEKDELISISCDLIRRGAHVDRINANGDMAGAGLSYCVLSFDWASLTSLKCIAARTIKNQCLQYRGLVPKELYDFIEMH